MLFWHISISFFFLHLKKTPSEFWLSKAELTLPNTLTFDTEKLNISQNCNKLKREKNINNENYVRHLASCCTKDQKKEVYMLCVVFFYDYDYAQIGNEKNSPINIVLSQFSWCKCAWWPKRKHRSKFPP